MSTKSCYFFRTTGTYEATFNQGPWNVGTINKLLHVKLSGSIMASTTDYETSTFYLDNPSLWGIEMIAHGGTPLDLVFGANDSRWLGQGAVQLGEEPIVVGGSESTFFYNIQTTLAWEWFGQMTVGEDVDFYLAIADAWGDTATWAVGGMLQVDWA
jgi:hypothetical protein